MSARAARINQKPAGRGKQPKIIKYAQSLTE
jgi:hypothetical protein